MPLGGQRFQSGNNWHIDALLAALVHKIEVDLVVEKHLGDDKLRPGVHLLLQVAQVGIGVGRLEVLFGVARRADAEIRRGGAFLLIIQIDALVHAVHLLNQLTGVAVPVGMGFETGFRLHGIAPQHQHVLDAQKVQVDEHVFGVFF